MEILKDNNILKLQGVISKLPVFSHEVFEEKYYQFFVKTKRLSNIVDELPVIVSEKIIDVNQLEVGKQVEIDGQIRSYNLPNNNGKNKLILSIFVKEIELSDIEEENIPTLNEVNFIGFLCKKPIYRKTPLGREISDILVAVNRSYKKSDYVPCILWGRNAKFSENLEVGSKVKLTGRIQSREYEKKYEDGTSKQMTAYEVSASMFSVIKEEQ